MSTVCLITLGCPKNIVEGESIAGLLQGTGYGLTTDLRNADAAVIHTCSFIADAREESERVIRACSRLKNTGRLGRVIVTGCLGQERGRALIEEFPGIDAVAGTGGLNRLPDLLEGTRKHLSAKPGGLLESPYPRLLSSALPSAYLRLSEGCNHRCGFCIIPRLRGAYASRSMKSILDEARELAQAGVAELVLVAQDTTCYGKDRYGRYMLPALLEKLSAVRGIRWIRLLYAHPSSVTDELLAAMRSLPNVCRYLDVPLQHVNDEVLRRMGRPAGARRLVEKIRKAIPDIALRTTFIAGFPGETEARFRELERFVREGWFDFMGAFSFSPQPGTPAASLSGGVPDRVKAGRQKRLMLEQKEVVRGKHRSLRGLAAEVLIEHALPLSEKQAGLRWFGRAAFQAPEIDGGIIVNGRAKPGDFVNVTITGSRGYDLTGATGMPSHSKRHR